MLKPELFVPAYGQHFIQPYFYPVRKQKKNIVLEQVLVENYAAEGKSLARRDGKVIFIEGTVPGDVVDVRLGKVRKTGPKGIP